jgi:hypothetical protein
MLGHALRLVLPYRAPRPCLYGEMVPDTFDLPPSAAIGMVSEGGKGFSRNSLPSHDGAGTVTGAAVPRLPYCAFS